jgi:TetR/AcrR family transcriptional repressor of nem operon
LATELIHLPTDIQSEVTEFFDACEEWLSKLLADGRGQSSFAFRGPPRALARLIFAALQGALITTRHRGGEQAFDEITSTIKRLLKND